MKKLLTLALLPLLIFACEETNLPLEPVMDTSGLNGSWDWVKSSKTNSDHEITPGSDLNVAGNFFMLEHRLFFLGDQLKIRVNNDSPDWLLIRESSYVVKGNQANPQFPLVELSNNQMETVPDIGGVVAFGNNLRIEEVTPNELVLSEVGDCEDCWVYTFKKTE